jgi:hypothetical protein
LLLGSLRSYEGSRVSASNVRSNLSLNCGTGSLASSILTLSVLLYPGMILDLVEGVPLVRVKSEYTFDQVPNFRGKVIRELQIYILNTLVSLVIIVGLKRRETTAKFKT